MYFTGCSADEHERIVKKMTVYVGTAVVPDPAISGKSSVAEPGVRRTNTSTTPANGVEGTTTSAASGVYGGASFDETMAFRQPCKRMVTTMTAKCSECRHQLDDGCALARDARATSSTPSGRWLQHRRTIIANVEPYAKVQSIRVRDP
jgi:hypothetical protein